MQPVDPGGEARDGGAIPENCLGRGFHTGGVGELLDPKNGLVLLGSVVAPELSPDEAARLRERLEDVDWPSLLAVARNHAMTPAVHAGLLAKGLAQVPPREVRAYLAVAHRLNQVRNQRIMAQVEEIVPALNRLDICPVLLKGVAHIRLLLYDDPAARTMSDIDMLVPEQRLPDAVRVLHQLGYREAKVDVLRADHHHHRPLVRSDNGAPIELHREVVGRRWASLLPAQEVRVAARPVTIGRGEALTPAPVHLAMHNVIHAQFSRRQYIKAQLSLRDALELVLIQRRWPEAIDWCDLAGRLRANGGHGATTFYVRESSNLLHVAAPENMPATIGSRFAQWRRRQHGDRRESWLRRQAAWLAYEWAALLLLLDKPPRHRRLARKLISPSRYKAHAERVRAYLQWRL